MTRSAKQLPLPDPAQGAVKLEDLYTLRQLAEMCPAYSENALRKLVWEHGKGSLAQVAMIAFDTPTIKARP